MIGFVIVSHSAKLAEGVCELAEQAGRGTVRLAGAGGTNDPMNPIGTDAFKVLKAIESVYSDDGVVVLIDLGSAVLSAETALDLLAEDQRARVRLCSAPLVEGAVAAVSQAAAGATLDEILREAQTALSGKISQLGGALPATEAAPGSAGRTEEREVTLTNPLGLHARPAAQLIRLARRFHASVTIENSSVPAGPFDATSINGVLSLGGRQGHRLRLLARGDQAREALAAIAEFVESGCGEQGTEAAPPIPTPKVAESAPGQLTGIPASAGIAIGPLVKLHTGVAPVTRRIVADPEAEQKRLNAAIEGAEKETRALYEWARTHAGLDQAGIFDAQMLFLDDPELIAGASCIIATEHANAEFAWQAAAAKLANRLHRLEDPYLRARAADVGDVAARVLRRMGGFTGAAPALKEPSIIAAHDLAPSEVKDFNPGTVLGVCLETGSATAHSVILVRSMGIPAVVGVGPGISAVPDGTNVAIDGQEGRVWVSPDASESQAIKKRRQQWLAAREGAQRERHMPASTRDGRRIHVLANLKGAKEVAQALDAGAEGVGLLRTEFLFLGRAAAPNEEEQLAAYRAVADALESRPLVIRTLDIGGDKPVPYIELGDEANPVLGWRGIRVMLDRRDLLRTQLRAMLRAGSERAVDMMFPMISSLSELREAKAAVDEAEAELKSESIPFARGKVGIMIEVPAAVAVADQLAREADFFSIGSNDLIQYTMAADRTNARVAPLADPFQPAVLRMLQQTIDAARNAGIGVCLCGELAADPLATDLLIGLGLDEFSVSPSLIPQLKQTIGRVSRVDAEAAARQALLLDTSAAIRRYLSSLSS